MVRYVLIANVVHMGGLQSPTSMVVSFPYGSVLVVFSRNCIPSESIMTSPREACLW